MIIELCYKLCAKYVQHMGIFADIHIEQQVLTLKEKILDDFICLSEYGLDYETPNLTLNLFKHTTIICIRLTPDEEKLPFEIRPKETVWQLKLRLNLRKGW